MDNWLRRAAGVALLAGPCLSAACGSTDDDDNGSGGEGEAGASAAGTSGTQAAGSGGGGSSGLEPQFPCEVEDVIEAKCQRCHNQLLENGAPFPLLTWEDTRREYGLQLVYEAMLPAIESGFMPLTQLPLEPPVEPLGPQEKTLLLDWLADGAPAAFDASCD